jgi:hypothetical protein
MGSLDEAHGRVLRFKKDSLRERISALEERFRGADKDACATLTSAEGVDVSLLIAALSLKRASAQINEVVHAAGILFSLPHILRKGERVESLSLAAGNTGRSFDVETNLRVAEFKFIDWKGGPESIRQNSLFKDFYQLAECDVPKEKYIYVNEVDRPLKFLNGGRTLDSVMSKNRSLWKEFQDKYGDRFSVVMDYYETVKDRVRLEDLAKVVPRFGDVEKLIDGAEDD